MFTGIVETRATLTRVERAPGAGLIDLEIEVDAELAAEVGVGDSIAIDGCCLTVTSAPGPRLGFQAIPETLRLTSLGDRKPGEEVNLERAMRADARLDGHIVQGHVDATGRVRGLERAGDDVLLRIDCGPEIARLLVQKGSIAVDGVALTVVDPDPEGFSVALIPHTLKVTTLSDRGPGDRVNLEADVLGKYVFRYLEQRTDLIGSN